MDLRIVNTCNNDCAYCLEQSLRSKKKYIGVEEIYEILDNEPDKKVLNFYGGNPLLHPQFLEILSYSKKVGFGSISVLTNGFGLNASNIEGFCTAGLNGLGLYFISFDKKKHALITNNSSQSLPHLLRSIVLLQQRKMLVKLIIHVHAQNIDDLYRDVFLLNTKYGVQNIEFINYFPFDRPYDMFQKLLEYRPHEKRESIERMFKMIKKLNICVNFVKFSKEFFGNNKEFYNYQTGVIEQIGDEDVERLDVTEVPFCYKEKRCESCFIKDNCKFYAK